MNLDLIIGELRTVTTSFGAAPTVRIAGAAEFEVLKEAANLAVPAAYVIPLADDVDRNESLNGYAQDVRDGFAVVMVLSNTPDERGQTAVTSVHALRAEIWATLLGLVLAGSHGDYGPIEYDGGTLLHFDRKRLYYQLEFSALYHIDRQDTRQGVDLGAAPAFLELDLNIKDPVPSSTNVPDARTQKLLPPQ